MESVGNSGLYINKKGKFTTEMLCLIQHDGFEVMRQWVKRDDTIWVSPGSDSALIEVFCVLEGRLEVLLNQDRREVCAGDCFCARGLSEDFRLIALEQTELLYVTNKPVYDEVKVFHDELDRLIRPIDAKDNITYSHSRNVMCYTARLIDRLGARGHTLDELLAAALFHDVGKCGTPDEVLKKVGPLTREEYEIMTHHAADGYDILAPVFGETVAEIASMHHERLDGSGYPRGLREQEISFGSRVIAVADTFDAMTHHRPYNRIKTPAEAIAELRALTNKYDPEIIQALSDLIAEGIIDPEAEEEKA